METEIGTNESVGMAVRRAASAVTGQKPSSLRPLSEIIDTDALDALFNDQSDDAFRPETRLSFNYSNCRIIIDNSESISIEPLETIEPLSPGSDNIDRAVRNPSAQDTNQAATKRPSGSHICFVCQQPIRDELQRERGEGAHYGCRAERRCGITLNKWSERQV